MLHTHGNASIQDTSMRDQATTRAGSGFTGGCDKHAGAKEEEQKRVDGDTRMHALSQCFAQTRKASASLKIFFASGGRATVYPGAR